MESSGRKPCRHLSAISFNRISDRIESLRSILLKCQACPEKQETKDDEEDGGKESFFVCLTCLNCFCNVKPSISTTESPLDSLHLLKHARSSNHPLSYRLLSHKGPRLADEPAVPLEKEFYCAQCGGYPRLKEPGKKEGVLLEKIKKLLNEAVSQKASQVKVIHDASEGAVSKESRPRGLQNLGNTCFMNSVLQLLSATLQLCDVGGGVDSPIWQAIRRASSGIYGSDGAKSIIPREILSLLSKRYKKFASLQQQDAHDFLRLIFNSVGEECRQTAPNLADFKHTKPPSPHEELFGGQLVSRVICGRCKGRSDTQEPFLDISLSLRREEEKKGFEESDALGRSISRLSIQEKDDQETSDSDSEFFGYSLTELVSYWNHKCTLQGENGYYCEKCSPNDQGILQSATLQYFITSTPKFLILHLQRFKTHIRTTTSQRSKRKGNAGLCGYAVEVEKDHSSVQFPEILTVSQGFGDPDSDSLEYRLYGYIIHDGICTSSGHYTAVVKNRSNRWFHVSDTRVSEISPKTALDCRTHSPYLLFYQKLQ